MMNYQMQRSGNPFGLTAKSTIVTALLLCLFFSSAAVQADWKSDANARIESIRKRDVQITVINLEEFPINNVDVQINQLKHRFAFGTAIDYSPWNSYPNYKNFILNYFEWGVCEDATKWISNEPSRDYVTYSQADQIYNWCNSNGIQMRGHCLFWEQESSQMQQWVIDLPYATYPTPSELLGEVNERIDSAVSHYTGKFYGWDVDNEMLGSDSFYDRLGEAGRVHMFERARSVDPNCKLYMNEFYGNSFGSYYGWAYRDRANSLIGMGAPIDGLGIQGHIDYDFDPQSYYDYVLQPLSQVGLPILVTEFDIPQSDEYLRANELEEFYRICFSHASVEGIFMWEFWETSAWRWEGLVDSDWSINAAGERYIDLLDEWTTNTSDTTDFNGEADFRGFHGTYEITLTAAGEPNETYTIELEPGGTTALFILQMNIGTLDTTPPSPDPMTWASEPNATGPYSITMTATDANDNHLPVQYYFECTTDSDANSPTWQTSTTYVAQGLNPSTLYTFKVKARDNSTNRNETDWSGTASATTDPPDTTPPSPSTMTWELEPAAISSSAITMTATTATDDSEPVEYYFECTTDSDANSPDWQTGTSYTAQDLEPLTSYTFRVKARDSSPAQNETTWSSSESATTQAPPTDVNIIGDWVKGTSHTEETGYSRALIFIAHEESAGGHPTLTSVTYGGQTMTKIIEEEAVTTYGVYVAAFILDEAGIAAATSSTFVPTWSASTNVVAYASLFLSSVDQTDPVGDSNSAGTISGANPIETGALITDDDDMVILGATCSNPGSYTLNNDFTEGIDQAVGSTGLTGVTGHKSATGAPEIPSATYISTVSRQVIIGFVIQGIGGTADEPPAAPNNLVAEAGNDLVSLDWDDNNEPDLAGYNVYRSETSGGGSGYGQINLSLVVDSDYTDNDVNNLTPYYYVVRAVDANSNESGNSNEATATPDYQDCNDVKNGGFQYLSDIDGDCHVDSDDLGVIANYWLYTNCAGLGNCDNADLEPDGDVDLLDFSDFAIDWLRCNDPEDEDCTPNW